MALADVTATKPHRSYVATAWFRAHPAGATVQVNLVEYVQGRRYSVDTGGVVLGAGWDRLEVAHVVHRPGSRLGVEILAPDLKRGASLLVDDLAVVAHDASFMR